MSVATSVPSATWATTAATRDGVRDAVLHALDDRLRAAGRRRDLAAARRALDDAAVVLGRLEPRGGVR